MCYGANYTSAEYDNYCAEYADGSHSNPQGPSIMEFLVVKVYDNYKTRKAVRSARKASPVDDSSSSFRSSSESQHFNNADSDEVVKTGIEPLPYHVERVPAMSEVNATPRA